MRLDPLNEAPALKAGAFLFFIDLFLRGIRIRSGSDPIFCF
jgi:hypothetical protein